MIENGSTFDLTLVLPVYNEVDSIRPVVEEWLETMKNAGISYEIRICEDGSTDGTKDVMKSLAFEFPQIVLDSVDYRRGYGRAVLDGYANAQGQYVLVSDSDGQINPLGFKALWAKRAAADIMMGVRTPRHDPAVRMIYSFIFRLYFKTLFPCSLRDPSCPFVLIKRDKVRRLIPLLGYMIEGFWWGFVGAATKVGYSFVEVEIEHRKRFAGDTRVYKLTKMPKIIMRNGIGLIKLKNVKEV